MGPKRKIFYLCFFFMSLVLLFEFSTIGNKLSELRDTMMMSPSGGRVVQNARSVNSQMDVCAEWEQDMDSWWEYHPEWIVSHENDTHFCFSRTQHQRRAAFLRELYNVQYAGNCSNMTVKVLWSSGWGADFLNINDGLLYAVETKQPVQFHSFVGWHYAATKKGDLPVCPKKDLSCFFLNISSCNLAPHMTSRRKVINALLSKVHPAITTPAASWAYEYATRPQQWLRQAVYEYSKTVALPTPCTVMHVRRSDVVLHNEYSRKYHTIHEYIDAARKRKHSLEGRTILLLTDDQNAIEEATTNFPNLDWVYLDRKRHRGAEGGWEDQLPSKDPRREVIVILSTFRLVQQCDTLIHSRSGFSDYLNYAMGNPRRIDIDDGRKDVFSVNNSQTVDISQGDVLEKAEDNSTFCVGWGVNLDSWWEHHPEWIVSHENGTHYCFSHVDDANKAAFFRDVYNVQYNGDCSQMTVKDIWSSGWGADFLNVCDGLFYAVESKQPVQFHALEPWHYAAGKKGEYPVCTRKDFTCFFLDISSCRVPADIPKDKVLNGLLAKEYAGISTELGSWAYEYASRPKKWLRRAVYKYTASVKMSAPCTVIHVRRSDVVLHGPQSRRYHTIQEYVDAAQEKNHSLKGRTIFLLTDDQNAIDEATTQFPNLKWRYLNRQRHRGAEGGWENQIPSNDPRREVVILLSTFRLVQQCDTLIHSESGFSKLLYYAMDNPLRINIDEGKKDVRSANNSDTVGISQSGVFDPAVFPPADDSSFCVAWDIDMDSWWEHNPEWIVSSENDTHYCFSRTDDANKASFLRGLYNVQYKGNCSNMTVKEIWSSGWRADFLNIIDGLLYALESEHPVQFHAIIPWHYAATKKGDRPVCPTKDLRCFFLNISSCRVPANIPEEKVLNALLSIQDIEISNQVASWAYEYASRPQTWLRRAVYKYSRTAPMSPPCTVIHVRRADVAFHQEQSRRYHDIQEYVDAAHEKNHSLQGRTIFLLTDDQNAIDEATTQFPNLKWTYLDRKRHRGGEGGWENQTPSDDPGLEVIVILSTFRLIQQCDTFIHSESGFSDYLYHAMDNPLRINIDEGKADVRSIKNFKPQDNS